MMLLQQNGFNLHHYQKLATIKVRLFLNLFFIKEKNAFYSLVIVRKSISVQSEIVVGSAHKKTPLK